MRIGRLLRFVEYLQLIFLFTQSTQSANLGRVVFTKDSFFEKLALKKIVFCTRLVKFLEYQAKYVCFFIVQLMCCLYDTVSESVTYDDRVFEQYWVIIWGWHLERFQMPCIKPL